MRRRANGKTSARSRPAPRRKSTSARSSSSKGGNTINTETTKPTEKTTTKKVSVSAVSSVLNVLRRQLADALAWHDAHADFERAVAGLSVDARGRKPRGIPYSPWQLLEHLRLSQRDILEFCRNPKYVEMEWPADYWPKNDAPPDAAAWDASVAAFQRDRAALQQLATDPNVDLFATIPHGSGQTYLRELVLVIDHNAYHVGELVAVRRALGVWE
jgi:uncharacterized damage-inducible protein DinB